MVTNAELGEKLFKSLDDQQKSDLLRALAGDTEVTNKRLGKLANMTFAELRQEIPPGMRGDILKTFLGGNRAKILGMLKGPEEKISFNAQVPFGGGKKLAENEQFQFGFFKAARAELINIEMNREKEVAAAEKPRKLTHQ